MMHLRPSDWLGPALVFCGVLLGLLCTLYTNREGKKERDRVAAELKQKEAEKDAREEEQAKPIRLTQELETAWKECDFWQRQSDKYKADLEECYEECQEWRRRHHGETMAVLSVLSKK